MDKAISVTDPDEIRVVRMIALKSALNLERKGLRRKGRSALSIVKSEFGLRGNRESVYTQFCELVEREKHK